MGFVSLSFASCSFFCASVFCDMSCERVVSPPRPASAPAYDEKGLVGGGGGIRKGLGGGGASRAVGRRGRYLWSNSLSISLSNALQLLISTTVRRFGKSTMVQSPWPTSRK